MKLTDCIPHNKHDHTAVERATAIGYPGINPILPKLLEWIQDPNWPIAPMTAELLAQAGPEITPHLVRILNCDDDIWKHSVLVLLGPHLDEAVWTGIAPEAIRLSQAPTDSEVAEEVDLAARTLLSLRAAPKN